MRYLTEHQFNDLADQAELTDRDRVIAACALVDGLKPLEIATRYVLHHPYIYKRLRRLEETVDFDEVAGTADLVLHGVPVELRDRLREIAGDWIAAYMADPTQRPIVATPLPASSIPVREMPPSGRVVTSPAKRKSTKARREHEQLVKRAQRKMDQEYAKAQQDLATMRSNGVVYTDPSQPTPVASQVPQPIQGHMPALPSGQAIPMPPAVPLVAPGPTPSGYTMEDVFAGWEEKE